MGILEKISEIEKEIARTQKNKGNGISLTNLVSYLALLELFASLLSSSH